MFNHNLKNVEVLLAGKREFGSYLLIVKRDHPYHPFVVVDYCEGADEWNWGHYHANFVSAAFDYANILWGWDKQTMIDNLKAEHKTFDT